MFNEKYYKDGKMLQLSPKATAIHTWDVGDGMLIAIFQGNRGEKPDLDFRVKYLNAGAEQHPIILPHVDWIVDVLMKAQNFRNDMIELLDFFIDYYEKCNPFHSVDDREKFEPRLAGLLGDKYSHVEVPNTLPITGLALVIELFCICEKQTTNAHQFKLLLLWTKRCLEGELNYRAVLNLAITHREY